MRLVFIFLWILSRFCCCGLLSPICSGDNQVITLLYTHPLFFHQKENSFKLKIDLTLYRMYKTVYTFDFLLLKLDGSRGLGTMEFYSGFVCDLFLNSRHVGWPFTLCSPSCIYSRRRGQLCNVILMNKNRRRKRKRKKKKKRGEEKTERKPKRGAGDEVITRYRMMEINCMP